MQGYPGARSSCKYLFSWVHFPTDPFAEVACQRNLCLAQLFQNLRVDSEVGAQLSSRAALYWDLQFGMFIGSTVAMMWHQVELREPRI